MSHIYGGAKCAGIKGVVYRKNFHLLTRRDPRKLKKASPEKVARKMKRCTSTSAPPLDRVNAPGILTIMSI